MTPDGLSIIAGAGCYALAGYMTVQHRDQLKLVQQEFQYPPAPVVGLVILGCLLCSLGLYRLAGELKPVSAASGQEKLDATALRSDFMSFHHRGHAMIRNYPPVRSL